MFRYWDGQAWSEQTTSDPSSPPPGAPAPPPPPTAPTQAPGQQYPQQQYDPYQQQYAPQPQPGQYGAGGGYGGQPPVPGTPGGSGGSGKRIALILLAVVVVAALGLGSFFVVSAATDDDGDKKASDDTSQTDEPTAEPTDESGSPTDETESPSDEPTDETESPTDETEAPFSGDPCVGALPGAGGQVRNGRISGGGLTLPRVSGYSAVEQQITTTFTFADEVAAVDKTIVQGWIALYAVGGLPRDHGYTDLAESADQVLDCMTQSPNFYRGFTGRDDLERNAIEVDGHEAFSVTTQIRIDDPSFDLKGDHARVVVVDTGDEDHLGLYVSVVPIGDKKLIRQQENMTEKLRVGD